MSGASAGAKSATEKFRNAVPSAELDSLRFYNPATVKALSHQESEQARVKLNRQGWKLSRQGQKLSRTEAKALHEAVLLWG